VSPTATETATIMLSATFDMRLLTARATATTRAARRTSVPRVTLRPSATRVSAPTQVACPGFNYTCNQLTCAQAYACLRDGNRQLDANHDGIPCNKQCT
jgi:hypothetical protein